MRGDPRGELEKDPEEICLKNFVFALFMQGRAVGLVGGVVRGLAVGLVVGLVEGLVYAKGIESSTLVPKGIELFSEPKDITSPVRAQLSLLIQVSKSTESSKASSVC